MIRLRAALAGMALALGIVLVALGQLALEDSMKALLDRDPQFAWTHLPGLPRHEGPGILGLVVGALLAGIGLRFLVPPEGAAVQQPSPESGDPPPPSRRRRAAGWTLIAAGVGVSAGLCAHIALTNPVAWGDAQRVLFFAYVRPAAFALSILLAGAGCWLLGRRVPRPPLRADVWDGLWMVGAMAAFAAATVPTLESWRYIHIGDEYAFYQVAYELYSARYWDMFWQAGVYSTHPLMSSWIPSLTMRLFGDDLAGWKLGLVAMGLAAIPITYLAARWLFDRTTAQVGSAVVATSHYLYAYSHTGHNNIDSVPWVALTALLVGVALIRPSPLLWYAAGAATGASLYWFFAARVAGLMIAVGMLQRGRRRFRDGLAPALLGTAIVAAPFLVRNQTETITRMLAESATTKQAPFEEVLRESLGLVGWSALAFHWSPVHGLYLSLGLLDPFSAALSAIGIGAALFRLSDWRRRTLVIWYCLILLLAGGLARHSGISAPRLLVAVPLLGIFVGDAVSGVVRSLGRRLSPAGIGRVGTVVALLLAVLFAGANLHRFRIVTPTRNPTNGEMLATQALYSPECRQAGARPLLLWGGRAGSMWIMAGGMEPNVYEPLFVIESEYWAVPEYQRWPCAVAVDPRGAIATRMQTQARRANAATRTVAFPDDGRRAESVAILQPAPPEPAGPPGPGRTRYAVAHTNRRRGAAFGALLESNDLAPGADGRWLVTDRSNRRVTEFDADWRAVAQWDDGLAAPIAAAGDARRVVVADVAARRLVEMGPDRRLHSAHDWDDLGIGQPRALALHPDGSLLVAAEGENHLARFDAAWQRTQLSLAVPGDARPFRPTDVRVHPDGSVYAYEGAGRVRRARADGQVVGTWDTGVREGRLAVASDGSFWVAGSGARGVVGFAASGERLADLGANTFLGGVGEGGIAGIGVDDRGRIALAWRYAGVVAYRVLA